MLLHVIQYYVAKTWIDIQDKHKNLYESDQLSFVTKYIFSFPSYLPKMEQYSKVLQLYTIYMYFDMETLVGRGSPASSMALMSLRLCSIQSMGVTVITVWRTRCSSLKFSVLQRMRKLNRWKVAFCRTKKQAFVEN